MALLSLVRTDRPTLNTTPRTAPAAPTKPMVAGGTPNAPVSPNDLLVKLAIMEQRIARLEAAAAT